MRKKKKSIITPFVKLSTQERHKRVWEALFYSHQRMDILLIAISGAGIYVCLETLRYSISNKEILPIEIKISAVVLLIAIIFNFISQWCASRVHYNDYCISTIDFSCEEDSSERSLYADMISLYECKIRIFSKIDKVLSFIAMLLMFIGLTIIVLYFFLTS